MAKRHLWGFSFPEQTTHPPPPPPPPPPALVRFHCMLPPRPLLRHLSVLAPLQVGELMPDQLLSSKSYTHHFSLIFEFSFKTIFF